MQAEATEVNRWLPPGVQWSSQAYELLADRLMHVVSGGAWKIVSYVARRTVGFGKDADRISLSQFCSGIKTRDGRQLDYGTGLSRTAAIRALREAESKQIIDKTAGQMRVPPKYALNWEKVLNAQNPTSSESPPVGSSESLPEPVVNRYVQESDQIPVLQPTDDIDSLPMNPKKRDSSTGGGSVTAEEIKALIAKYMECEPAEVDDKIASRVVGAANGASYDEVFQFLKAKWNEGNGKYRVGKPRGPRTFAWFVRVLSNHFPKKHEEAVKAIGYRDRAGRNSRGGDRLDIVRFEQLLSAIELPDAGKEVSSAQN